MLPMLFAESSIRYRRKNYVWPSASREATLPMTLGEGRAR
jgi:hypothetical protein